jgi:signal transduction histidine kinase/phage shock protein PspC (stress-responsive transcriptional regulator)
MVRSRSRSPACDDDRVDSPSRQPAARPVERRPLTRPREGRAVAGVAAGLAAHLDLPVRMVRIGLALSVLANGFGLVLYAWLWALLPALESVPAAGTAPAGAAQSNGSPAGSLVVAGVDSDGDPAGGARRRWRGGADVAIGLVLLAGGVVLLASRLGLPVRPQFLVPLLVVGAGAVLAFTQLDEVERSRWAARTGVGTRAAAVQAGVGVILVVIGLFLLIVPRTDPAQLGRTALAALVVLGGVGLVLAPWGLRLWRNLDDERAARVREAARSDIAAHLHDSVLQTLALIQRRSGDPAEVARLARAQERDLRGWLYGEPTADQQTLAAQVAAIAAGVEDVHGVLVEVVTVGDGPVDARSAILLAALREAVVNAARHAGGPVRVYLECGPDEVEAFVRDRGPGFAVDAVPGDRLGVRESIIGRMERHGGSARVRSTPGEGTEVRLVLPVHAETA